LGKKKLIKISFKESLTHRLKQHKHCSYEECSEFLDEWKQAKLEWLQELGKINEDNPKAVRRVTRDSRHFWDKRWNMWKARLKNLKLTFRTGILDVF
jgi:hypothetical protein